ncbi:MAG TPA: hypothetical protein VLM40_02165 [Gemmata sp.]|nr:hypothetical protein [Gemmata sp.]
MYTYNPVYHTITRTVPRFVRCEHCGEGFIYELARAGYGEAGHGITGDRESVCRLAYERAIKDLDRELAGGAEAVPCPKCLKYQEHMLAAARKLQWGWLRGLAGWAMSAMPVVAFFAVLIAVVLFEGNTELALLVASGTAVLFLLTGLVTAIVFHLTPCRPNTWSESFRRMQAEALACTREEFALASVDGGPFSEELTYGREEDYKDTLFLWVLPEEIASEATVPLVMLDGREIEVELDADDDDGVFLDEDRVDDEEDREYRICLRVFNLHRPRAATEAVKP